MRCQWSGMEVRARIDPSIPVECPECGAIRRIPGNHVWSDMFIYPPHDEPENRRLRRHWQRVNGVWTIVE